MKRALLIIFIITLVAISFEATAEEIKKDSTQEISTTAVGNNFSRPWWLGDLITLAGIAIGVGIIIYKLGKQHKNNLNIQKENYREKLRLNVYQEFSKILDDASTKAVKASSYANQILTSIKIYQDCIKNRISPSPVTERSDELRQRNKNIQDSIIELIYLFEKYEIISPELKIFKLAMNVSIHDIRESFMTLHSFSLRILPMNFIAEDGSGRILNIVNPTDTQINELNELVSDYANTVYNLSGYLYDLNIELQNSFLSKLFDNQIPRREPLDPNVKVITTDSEKAKKLRKYFEEETNWGKKSKETREAVQKNINEP